MKKYFVRACVVPINPSQDAEVYESVAVKTMQVLEADPQTNNTGLVDHLGRVIMSVQEPEVIGFK